MKVRPCFLWLILLLCVTAFLSCDPNNQTDDQQPPEEPGIEDQLNDQQPPAEPGNFEPGTGEIGADGHPVGWTEESHSKKADPNYDLLFGNSDSEVLRFDIKIAPSDWQAMMEDMKGRLGPFGNPSIPGVASGCEGGIPENPMDMTGGGNPIYVPCDLVFKGVTWYHVGLRFKGNSSLVSAWQNGSYKLSMRFNTDKFEDEFPEIKNQRIYGFDSLSLVSSNLDETQVREKIGGDIYQFMGVPVVRRAYCRAFVDYGQGKKYFGLYILQEIPAKPMLETQFIEDDGNLYKPDGLAASFAVWNTKSFDKETNEDKADFSDVRELYDVLHSDRRDEAAFRASIESVFDVDGFLRYLAVNQVISNWDTYGRMAHNYYLYHDPGDDLFHWIPWDFTATLHAADHAYMPPLSLELRRMEVGNQWPLIRYLIDIPDYHDKYVAYVQKTIDDAFYPERMKAIYAKTKALIEPYVIGEYGEVKGYTNLPNKSSFTEDFEYLNKHVDDRYKAAEQFLKNQKAKDRRAKRAERAEQAKPAEQVEPNVSSEVSEAGL